MTTKEQTIPDKIKLFSAIANSIITSIQDNPDHFLRDTDIFIPKVLTGPNNNEFTQEDTQKFLIKINERTKKAIGSIDFIYLFPNNINIDSLYDKNTKTLKTPETIGTNICIRQDKDKKKIITLCVKDAYTKLLKNDGTFNYIKDRSYYNRKTMIEIAKFFTNEAYDLLLDLAPDTLDIDKNLNPKNIIKLHTIDTQNEFTPSPLEAAASAPVPGTAPISTPLPSAASAPASVGGKRNNKIKSKKNNK